VVAAGVATVFGVGSADCWRFLREVERFAVGFQDAALAIVLQGDVGDVRQELVGGRVVVQRDLE
jgi:hypothetical protein